MTNGQSGTEAREAGGLEELTTGNVLRLLGAGASGAILMALGEGPLRTKELTERIDGYAPRTIYRYATRLTEIGVIEREEERGVPSKVVHSLTDPAGRELHELVDAYAKVSLGRLPSGRIGASEWGSLALVADLWESGMIDELNLGPKSSTELARGEHGWSFHQVSRRAGLFAQGGFVTEASEGGRRRYALTDKARRVMALIAGIGRWRRRYVVPKGMTGLTAEEVGGLMRTVLPLVSLPEHGGKSFEIEIVPGGSNGAENEWVLAKVGADGTIANHLVPEGAVDGSVRGKVVAWVDSVLDGPHEDLDIRGDVPLLEDCLRRLHETLWGSGGE